MILAAFECLRRLHLQQNVPKNWELKIFLPKLFLAKYHTSNQYQIEKTKADTDKTWPICSGIQCYTTYHLDKYFSCSNWFGAKVLSIYEASAQIQSALFKSHEFCWTSYSNLFVWRRSEVSTDQMHQIGYIASNDSV